MAVNDYLTLSQFKAALPDFDWVGGSNTKYDTLITSQITAASRAIDKATNRKPGAYFVNADVTRYFNAPNAAPSQLPYHDNRLGGGYGGSESRRLWIGELAAAPTSVSISLDGSFNYTALLSTDYIVGEYNALDDGEPYQWIDLDILYGHYQTWYGFRKGVQVVGKFGWSATVPADIQQAMTEWAIRWFELATDNYIDHGTDGNIPLNQTYFGSPRFSSIESDLYTAVQHYRRMAV